MEFLKTPSHGQLHGLPLVASTPLNQQNTSAQQVFTAHVPA